jgi:hypothetical protein
MLGINDSKIIYSELRKWLKYRRNLLSIIHGDANNRPSLDDASCEPFLPKAGSTTPFFISFHYGLYPLLVEEIVNKLKYKSVMFLIHEHNNDIKSLERLCKTYQCDVEFIPVDAKGKFVRRLLKGKKSNAAIFMLVDLPVNNGTSTLTEMDCFDSGKLQVLDGFMRIANVLKTQPTLIYNEAAENRKGLKTIAKIVDSSEQVFSTFASLVTQNPFLYERMHDLHTFFKPTDSKNSCAMCFRSTVEGEYFLYESKESKTFRINKRVFSSVKSYDGYAPIENNIKNLIKEKFDVSYII